MIMAFIEDRLLKHRFKPSTQIYDQNPEREHIKENISILLFYKNKIKNTIFSYVFFKIIIKI